MNHMEIICQGWLTKSPPERKLHGILATFRRARWRRRYFVLHKPAGSLPDVYALDYFRDSALGKRVSHVDLEQCEQVDASLESGFYQYLFSIRTKQKGRDRTYYLAAATEEEMTRWVNCLCQVCNLKQEEDVPEDIPTEEVPAPPPPERMDSIPMATTPPRRTEMPAAAASSPPSRRLNNASPVDEKGYIPLEECTSGSPAISKKTTLASSNRQNRDSIGSLPDAPPPPPPPEKGVRATDDDTYDSPPMRVMPGSRESQDLYNVPPVRTVTRRQRDQSSVDSCYDVPPTREMNRDSIRTSSSSGYRTSGDTYDVPPLRRSPVDDSNLLDSSPRPRSNTCNDDSRARSHLLSDPYDVPPMRSRSERDMSAERDEVLPPPPPRPPKPMSPDRVNLESRPAAGRSVFSSNTSSLYDVPPLSGVRSTGSFGDDVYDSPKSLSVSDAEPLRSPPPQACPPPGSKPHKYVNAATGYVKEELDLSTHKYVNSPPPPQSAYDVLPSMDRLHVHDPEMASHSDTSSTGSVELNQPIPAPRQQGLVMAGYADMTQQYTPMSEHVNAYSVPPPSNTRSMLAQSTVGAYDIPPLARNGAYAPMSSASSSAYSVLPSGPSRPVNGPARSASLVSGLPPRSGYRMSDQNQAGDLADTYACNIVQTPRTRSFKKKSPAIPSRKVSGPFMPPVTNHVLLPQKAKTAHSSSDSESGSEFDEDSMTYDVPPTRWRRPLSATPPPPLHSHKPEIQYLDLDLESTTSSSDKHTLQAHSPPPGGASPTEYNEIDLVRTAALWETMRDVESSRRTSDKTDG